MSPDSKSVKKHFESQFKAHLEKNDNHPVIAAMRRAIFLYSDRPIRLTKDLHASFMKIRHRTKGFTIKNECLSLFPVEAQDKLRHGLSMGSYIVAFSGYIFTLPLDRFEFIDDPSQERFV